MKTIKRILRILSIKRKSYLQKKILMKMMILHIEGLMDRQILSIN
jgi:hypothetical protein